MVWCVVGQQSKWKQYTRTVVSCCSKFDLGLASAPCIPYRHPRVVVRGSTVPTSSHSCAGLYRATATASSFAAPFPLHSSLRSPLHSTTLRHGVQVSAPPAHRRLRLRPRRRVPGKYRTSYRLNFPPTIFMFLIFILNQYCRFHKGLFPNQPFLWVPISRVKTRPITVFIWNVCFIKLRLHRNL